ncbi:TPA: hypothetical protein IAA91_06190 [Candidatus Avacholeplasma faecigallinarum]|nr:hypothetical protein [Candidatus Avacholeplasma faecigallinarum]
MFDEYILSDKTPSNLNEQYQNALKKLSYEVSFDFDINYENKKKVNAYLYKLLGDKKSGSFKIKKEEILSKDC